jgi:hypothetical protein
MRFFVGAYLGNGTYVDDVRVLAWCVLAQVCQCGGRNTTRVRGAVTTLGCLRGDWWVMKRPA